MNANTFYIALAQALNIPNEGIVDLLDNGLLNAASLDAARAYSRYRPLKRRMGDAALAFAVSPTASDNTVLFLVGGLPNAGDTLTLDAGGWSPEDVTVAAVSVATDSDIQTYTLTGITIPLLKVTLESAVTLPHPIGTWVTPKLASGQTQGLTMVSGQDRYRLPLDFLRPDKSSLDQALGIGPGDMQHAEGYFDIAYYRGIRQFGGGSYGTSMAYAPGASIWGNYPIVGNPFNNPNSGRPQSANNQGLCFHFASAPIPLLTVTPSPSSNATLDFYYSGLHTLASIPESDADALGDYAKHWATIGMAGAFAAQGLEKIGRWTLDYSRSSKDLQEIAAAHLANFEKKIRNAPYMTSG